MSTLIAASEEQMPASLFDTENLPFEAMAKGAVFTDARSREGVALAAPFRPVDNSRPGLTDHERDVLGQWGWTYQLLDMRVPDICEPVEIISCRVCGHDSYHPDDRTNLYCSFCNAFHQDRERIYQSELDAREVQSLEAEIVALDLETNQI